MTNLKTYFRELFEAETFKARSKESGKLVQFKSKDAYNAAVKAGTHEDPKAPKSGKAGGKDSKKDVPKANIFDKPSKSEPAADSMATVNSIASMTGLRTQAVAGWADENGVNLSKVADDIKSKKLKPMDFMTAVSGNPGNKYAKDIIAKYSNSSSSKASEPTSQSEPKQSSKPDSKLSISQLPFKSLFNYPIAHTSTPGNFQDWYRDGMKLKKGRIEKFSPEDDKQLRSLINIWWDEVDDVSTADFNAGRDSKEIKKVKKDIQDFLIKKSKVISKPTSQSEPKQSSKPDTQGDKFELGTPAVYTDNGKEYSGEVVMNPSNQRVQINGQWTTIGKGTVKGIQTYGSGEFIVPDNWNDAKSFDDSMEEPAAPAQPKQQRKGNPQVNKAAKSAAEEAGITPQKLGGEYKDTMLKAAVEALTDSNYHDEARALVAAIEGKPEWAKKPEYPSMDDPKYNEKMKALRTTGVDSSEYWDYDDKTGRFARKVSSEAGWDGAAAVDGIAFTLRMNGFHKEADMIQSVLNESVTRLTGILKETTYFKKQSKSKSLNEAFNAKDLPNWLFDDPVDFEDWYEDGMKLSNNKGKIAPFSSSDEKKLFQLVGVWQDSEGDYQYGRGDYGTGKTTGARSASYTAQDDIKKFLTQKGKVVNETIKQKK